MENCYSIITMTQVSDRQTNLLLLLGLKDLTKEEEVAVISELQLLSSSTLLKFAINNLKDNKDLLMWLALSDSSDSHNPEPYNFLKEKIPDFEKRYLQELRQELNLITKKSP